MSKDINEIIEMLEEKLSDSDHTYVVLNVEQSGRLIQKFKALHIFARQQEEFIKYLKNKFEELKRGELNGQPEKANVGSDT